jgi:CheY-like chemotaxis protein
VTGSNSTSRNDPKLVLALVSQDSAREILQNAVVSFGQSLEIHAGADTFMTRLNTEGADVLILDLQDPRSMKVLKHLHSEGNHRPVLVLAGIERRAELLEAQRLGVFAVVPSPLSEEEIGFHIGHALTTLAERFDPRLLGFQQRLITLGNDFALVTPVALSLVECSLPYYDPRRTAVTLGLVEILTNAIEHGSLGISYEEKREALRSSVFYDLARQRSLQSPWKDRRVFARSLVDPEEGLVRFQVKDEGDGFDWRNMPDPFSQNNLGARHGRGILMASHAFQSLRYNEKGNTVTLELLLETSTLPEAK